MRGSVKEKNILSPKTVFIVDDEPLLGEIAEVILNSEGYLTRRFLSPFDLLDAIEPGSFAPQIVVTDYLMNGMNGLELIRRLRQSCPDIRIVLVSGTISECLASSSVDTRPDYFLAKPYQVTSLIHAVEAALAPDPHSETAAT